MQTFLLNFLDLFKWFFVWLHIDYEQMRAIVDVKLAMDNRRQVVAYQKKSKKESSNSFVLTLLFYGLFGIFIAFAIYFITSFMLGMIVFFSYIMVMVIMTLITDFSSILLDTSDNTIILPRPVDGRTLFVARIVHILLYLGQLAIGLSIASAIVVLIKYGVVLLLIFMIAICLAIFTAVCLTNAFYLLLLQFANEEKLKNIINYFQIFMAVAIMGGYQIVPRIMGRIDIQSFVFEIQWWSYFVPPIWLAGMLETFYIYNFDENHLALTACAIIFPLAATYLVNKYLSPIFSRKLSALGSGGVEQTEKPKSEKGNFMDHVSGWFTNSLVERGSFDVIYKLLGRDRKIKLKVYPAFGYIIVFGFIFMVRSQEDFDTTWANLPTTNYHLMLIYLTFIVLQVALHEIPYSDDFKASWIYFSSPLEAPGEILAGTIKAVFVRLFIPGYLAISIFVLAIWKFSAIDDLVFGAFNNFIMLLIFALINKRKLPFSMAPNTRAQAGNLMRGILSFLVIGMLGMAHFFLAMKPILIIGAIPLQIVIVFLLHRLFIRTTWKQISF